MYFLVTFFTVASLVGAGVMLFHREYSHRPGAKVGATLLLLLLLPLWWGAPRLAQDQRQQAHDVQKRNAIVERGAVFAEVIRQETAQKLDRVTAHADPLSGAWFLAVEATNVRQDARRSSKRIVSLAAGDSVWVPGGALRSGEWVQITKPDRGWVNERYFVIPAILGEMGLVGWNHRPYFAIRTGNVRAAPSLSSPVIGQVERGEKCVHIDQKGLWLRIRQKDRLGWVHASNLRLATSDEATAAYVEASKFSLRYAFPEDSFLGKALGVCIGIAIGLILAFAFPRWKMSDNARIAKMSVSILYFAIKNRAQLIGMSSNELFIMLLLAALLGIFVDLFGESVVERLRTARFA